MSRRAPALSLPSRELVENALCASMVADGSVSPDLWHPKRRHPRLIEPAARICDVCPVRLECLEYALRHKEQTSGVWGGRFF